MSLGFAHSAATVGERRRVIGRSVDLKQTVCSGGRQAVVRSVDLKQHVCIYVEIQRMRFFSRKVIDIARACSKSLLSGEEPRQS